MTELKCKLLVIGAGPGGYVTAIRAGQLGVDTIIVDMDALGGTCLNVGCIPSKALIHAAEEFHLAGHLSHGSPLGISVSEPSIDLRATMKWKGSIVKRLTGGVGALLSKAKVRVVPGRASFMDGKTVEVSHADGTTTIRAENIVIATGSRPVELPFLPFGGKVISSTEALALKKVPDTLAVIGAGYIGLELGMAYAKLGAKVTIIEAMDRILPTYDSKLTRPVLKRLKSLGITLHTGARAKDLSKDKTALVFETKDGKRAQVAADQVLVTVGRKPATDGWGREAVVLDMDGPFVKIDARCQTSMSGIYAIGDVTGEPMLAHRAMAQGEMVAEIVAGHTRVWDKIAIPAVCFTDPEVLVAGLSPDEAKAAGYKTLVSEFPFTANGRAMTMEAEDGFIRIVAREDNHLVLGIQAVGKGVSELAASFGLALEMGARLEDIAGTIHAHPTQGEALQETALRALGQALHI